MRLSDSLHLSQDAVFGMPVTTIIGKTEVHIENFKAIAEYNDSLVRIKTKCGIITVTGSRLSVIYYNDEEIHIKGLIESVIP